jgi:N-acetylglucosaminyldiphosphoundecaprenol N-acetyl-beta-D-mannosaminyltransferase
VDAFKLGPRYGGVSVNMRDGQALLSGSAERMRAGEGFAVATLNLDHLVKLRDDPAFRDAYLRHEFVVADGNPVVWTSWLAGRPVRLAPGADLVVPFARLAAAHGLPVALVGATAGTLGRAARALEALAPGLEIVAEIAPPFPFDPDGPAGDAAIAALREAGARFVILALGAPRQERFAARCRRELPQAGLASIGAGLDFLAGAQRRAPAWIRVLALEWLWRMLSDPARLAARYGRCALLAPSLIAEALRLRGVEAPELPKHGPAVASPIAEST